MLLIAWLFVTGCVVWPDIKEDTASYAPDDADGDGSPIEEDCDDFNSLVSPDYAESCWDALDNDCDGLADGTDPDCFVGPVDGDADGYASDVDCDDADASVHPGAEETWYDGVDQDCDGASDFDADRDGYESDLYGGDDCDDADAGISPNAIETCDGVDQDCDGTTDEDASDGTDWYADADGDGYGDAATAVVSCGPPDGYASNPADCDDADAAVNPAAEEICDDRIDNDCDPQTNDMTGDVWYADGDGDGYGDASASTVACDRPAGYVADASDCDDADDRVNPAGVETCDGIDQDCDGSADEYAADASTWYADIDGDGYGDPSVSADACLAPAGYVADSGDCDDNNAGAHPGSVEVCDGADQDCDGATDESAADASMWHADADGDGYGDAGVTATACDQPSGYVSDATDCDDGDGSAHPGSVEVCDAVDQDCDGAVDEGTTTAFYRDADGDGYGDPTVFADACSAPAGYVPDATDCDDGHDNVSPGGREVCDGLDNDCDGDVDRAALDMIIWYADADGDGYGDFTVSTRSCDQPAGYVGQSGDCDDADPNISPHDGDGDGQSTCAGDCDDTDPSVRMGGTETCDGTDQDCDGSVDESALDEGIWYRDADGDGYGNAAFSVAACDLPAGYTADATDCDDSSAGVHPGGVEVCDGADQDCDGAIDEGAADASIWYADADGDGYGDAYATVVSCLRPNGYVADASDCDDADGSAHPGSVEVCDGTDQDCDGAADNGFAVEAYYADADNDGYGDPLASVPACSPPAGYVADASDCDDGDASLNNDDADGDGYASCDGDCDDAEPEVSPERKEISIVAGAIDDRCADGVDDDCDGFADGVDWECLDDDGDGILNGIDALVPFDGDSDGDDDTLCVVAFSDHVMFAPWNGFDGVIQGDWTGGFSALGVSSRSVPIGPYADSDGDGTDDLSAWCVDFTRSSVAPSSTGAWNWRVVSSVAADAVSAAPATCSAASPSTRWFAMDIADYCAATGDAYCRTGYALSDGCGDALGGGVIRVRFDSSAKSIAPY